MGVWRGVLIAFLLWGCVVGQLVCNSGSLDTICTVATSQVLNEQFNSVVGNSLVILQTANLTCSIPMCVIEVTMNTSITVYGAISTSGTVQLNSSTVTINETGLLVANNITIEVDSFTLGGTVDVSGGGFGSNSGPGAGFNGTGAGGSYGGYSVSARANITGTAGPYGSISGELYFGSGGGSSNNSPGGSGGGMVSIFCLEEILFQNGQINANGQNASLSGGGSGGAVYLKASSLAGNGSISANGGASQTGGAGSGGRIWVDLPTLETSVSSSLAFSVYGGPCGVASRGGAGTLYFSHNDTLLIDNGYSMTTLPDPDGPTPVNDTYVASIIVRNAGVIMPVNSSINCSSLSLSTGALLVSPPSSADGGSILVNDNLQIDSYSKAQLSNWWDINATNITLSGIVSGSGFAFTVSGTFLLSGKVITDGLGSGPGTGPGAGQNGVGDNPGGGAGHGAVGSSSCGAATGGDQYGNPILPDIYGSGGGNTGTLLGGAGGGAIVINAYNFHFMGTLSANGLAGASGYVPQTQAREETPVHEHSAQELDAALTSRSGAGGGSGGSISIVAQWAGLGLGAVATAIGGSGGNAGGSGGFAGGGGAGGRIYFSANTTVFLQNQTNVDVSVGGGVTPCKTTSASGTLLTHCSPGHAGTQAPFMCMPCIVGEYSPDGLTCISCGPGTSTQFQQGQTACTPCAPGTYTYINGSAACTQCSIGRYANTTGSIYCSSCPIGTISNVTGATNCTPCGKGTYQPYIGYAYCQSCRSGTYTNTTGNSACLSCPSGYSSNVGSTQCTPCGPGTYSTSYGCSDCSSGRYSNLTANDYCQYCPAGSSSNYGSSYCSLCSVGYTAYSGGYCNPCPTGTYADTPGMYPCRECAPGTYQRYTGSTQCMPCKGSFTYGATYCDNSDSSDNPPDFLWWCIPLLFTVLLCLPAVWCWRRRRTQAYEPIRDQRNVNNRAPIATIVRPMEPPPFLPPLPPQRADHDAKEEGTGEHEQEKECIICCDSKKEIVLLPCGHIATCEKCTRALLDTKPLCPICRQKILSFVRMYAV